MAGGAAFDPLLRQLAAGLPEGRWRATPVDPRAVLGLATGLVGGALVLTAEPASLALAGAALAPVVVVASAIDVRWHRLPDRLTIPAAVGLALLVGAAALLAGDAGIVGGGLAGAALFAGFLLALHLVSPAGMGFGDVKLGLPLGVVVGATAVTSVFVALLTATVIGAVLALLVH